MTEDQVLATAFALLLAVAAIAVWSAPAFAGCCEVYQCGDLVMTYSVGVRA